MRIMIKAAFHNFDSPQGSSDVKKKLSQQALKMGAGQDKYIDEYNIVVGVV